MTEIGSLDRRALELWRRELEPGLAEDPATSRAIIAAIQSAEWDVTGPDPDAEPDPSEATDYLRGGEPGCEASPTCQALTLGGDRFVVDPSHGFSADFEDMGLGLVGGDDFLVYRYADEAPGSYSLAGANAQWATCEQCVGCYLDDDTLDRRFFVPESGELIIGDD